MTRIEKLRERLPDGFEAALVENRFNRAYLTGFDSSSGLLVITGDRARLIVDFRYIEAARRGVRGDIEVELMADACAQARAVMDACGAARALVESTSSLEAFERLREKMPGISLAGDSALTDAIRDMRAVKDEDEIAAIKAAQAITDAAFGYILGVIKPGLAEREIAAELEYYMRRNGADGLAFPTICVAGAKTSLPHGEPGDYRIKSGDLLTMDFGALKNGYCSDMTRTVAVGDIGDEQKRLYETVLGAHLAAQEAARAGITGRELDAVARVYIEEKEGYKGCFGHGLGHSLGLEIHESPSASPACESLLTPGTVITIEPGVYLKGRFGARIENMVVLREDGCENLTDSERELIIL
jgi:Xaa-Pro aminopeptidase